MSDFMNWLYSHYIKPGIAQQPMDDGERMWADLLDNDLYPAQRQAFESVCAFQAVQGFRLGLKLGLALSEDLK